MGLTFHASLPATYPKTLPKLSLSFSEALSSKLRAEAEHVLKTKPTSMLGSEMMYEITTSLQDVLDRANYHQVQDVPALNEERANREAVVLQQAQKEQAEKQKEKHQATIDEEQYLAEMVANQKSREEKRREKLTSGTSKDSNGDPSKLPSHSVALSWPGLTWFRST